jgi:hypothetical protein
MQWGLYATLPGMQAALPHGGLRSRQVHVMQTTQVLDVVPLEHVIQGTVPRSGLR